MMAYAYDLQKSSRAIADPLCRPRYLCPPTTELASASRHYVCRATAAPSAAMDLPRGRSY